MHDTIGMSEALMELPAHAKAPDAAISALVCCEWHAGERQVGSAVHVGNQGMTCAVGRAGWGISSRAVEDA